MGNNPYNILHLLPICKKIEQNYKPPLPHYLTMLHVLIDGMGIKYIK